jgi:hypothetical protein
MQSLEALRNYFKPQREQVQIIERGVMPQVAHAVAKA